MSPVKSEKDKIVSEKDEIEGLPPGWTIEVRTRHKSRKKIDRFYTDPVSGYIFRSLRDAQRYLETGELGRYAIKPRKRDRVERNKKKKKLHMQKREEASEAKQQTSDGSSRKRALDKPGPPTRASKRPTGVKVESPALPSQPDTRTRPVNSATAKDKKTEASPVTPKQHNKEIEKKPASSPPREDKPPTPSLPSPPPAAAVPPVNPTVTNPILQNSHGYGSDVHPESSINFSMDDLLTDPCIEFAIKTLTGAIPLGDLIKVENYTTTPLKVPQAELRTDPCIDFTVKTFTGVTPVAKDDRLQYRPSSSTKPQGPHAFSLPNVGMNRVLDPGCFSNQQQNAFSLPNVGRDRVLDPGCFSNQQQNLQNSGKFVTRGMGQGSRSRFFQ